MFDGLLTLKTCKQNYNKGYPFSRGTLEFILYKKLTLCLAFFKTLFFAQIKNFTFFVQIKFF